MDVHTLLTYIQTYQVHHNLSDLPEAFMETPVKVQIEIGDGVLHLADLKGMFVTSPGDTLVLTTVNPLTLKL